MSIPTPDVKVLWAKSGNRCALCFTPLTREASSTIPVGEQAHIKGEHAGKNGKPSSARYDINQLDKERNSYVNLILLCPTCHTLIDKDEASYSVERLISIKQLHERKIETSITENALNVTFFELEDVLRHLVSQDVADSDYDLEAIPIEDKIKRNSLPTNVDKMIQIGLMSAYEVESFLNKNVDMKYAKKIRNAFVSNYESLKEENYTPNDTFFALLNVASNNNSDSKYMAAGLSVLAYYFQLCEVFEK